MGIKEKKNVKMEQSKMVRYNAPYKTRGQRSGGRGKGNPNSKAQMPSQ